MFSWFFWGEKLFPFLCSLRMKRGCERVNGTNGTARKTLTGEAFRRTLLRMLRTFLCSPSGLCTSGRLMRSGNSFSLAPRAAMTFSEWNFYSPRVVSRGGLFIVRKLSRKTIFFLAELVKFLYFIFSIFQQQTYALIPLRKATRKAFLGAVFGNDVARRACSGSTTFRVILNNPVYMCARAFNRRKLKPSVLIACRNVKKSFVPGNIISGQASDTIKNYN